MVFDWTKKLSFGVVAITLAFPSLKAEAIANAVMRRSLRGMYFATHYGNWYEYATETELREYLKELQYWGCKEVSAWFDMHDYTGMDDPAAAKRLKLLKMIFREAHALGMEANLTFLANEAFKNSPKELRADYLPGKNGYEKQIDGHYHVEICPSKPGGTELILKWRRQVLQAFADTPIDSIALGPYDQGGCTCDKCAPWGANAYLKLSKKLAALCREMIPGVKVQLSAWYFDKFGSNLHEWDGLLRQADDLKKWVDIIHLCPDDLDKMDAHPFLPYISMTEISMRGAYPWGGYGANPMPEHIQHELDAHPNCAGLRPYSEGIYEDLNKVMTLAVQSGKASDTRDAIRQYAERYFSPQVADDVYEAATLLEKNLGLMTFRSKVPLAYETNQIPNRVVAERALAALERAERKLTPTVRKSWRWRILKIRGEIDLSAAKGESPLVMRERFAELGRLYRVGPTTLGHVAPLTVPHFNPAFTGAK